MLELWFEILENIFYHPVRSGLIFIGCILAIYGLYSIIRLIVNKIRYRNWFNRQVWYVDGDGHIYQKDHNEYK